MEYISLEEILEAVQGKLYHKGNNLNYNDICIDTRKIKSGNIYIAIKGTVYNGNDFVEDAVQKGALLCIVDEISFDLNKVKDSTIIKVEDTKKALMSLAKYYRNKLDIKVIGVTGSTGKTTTKDLIAAALGSKFKVFKTQGNFNNEIGLPLMIFNLDSSYDIAVLEMGMSNLNEIHRLADVARPDIAVITNIGISHIENLGSRENILKAKLEITDFFGKDNVLIVNGDNDLLSNLETNKFNLIKVGFSKDFNYYSENVSLLEESIEYNVVEENKLLNPSISINIPGKHNVLNSLLAVACGRVLGLEISEINEGFSRLEATSMRLDVIRCNQYTIINDCYNASPDSMKAALDVQANMKVKRKIAVFGTMKELGSESYNAHKEVAQYANLKGIDILISVGDSEKAYREGFQKDDKFIHFDNLEEAGQYIKNLLKEGDLILFKASRAMKFENLVNLIKC
ncbi:MAG: UDP-N-acetylmuramoyl-tripeptide--D-alanyl-D-alanine ligase [Clostridiales bacterium]|uniref:UDP-N-acetylmuramoyl-tripeptide--D-alanyl-D- alanine ligase n=1 Tax=Clostridium sp. N3C TaxID=1776758 RepID=UPI00092DF57B|nr:UDP-N-acetylmuramoyl-tripeptide--D-alanyl-D-alanine ligase [Clostridium sp. N3C]NLZ47328.1 UDP-N-acetylmuramoyl-tripeptide--D-alanyl-D-alanine ligase [Clostridiales bacterium]SCN21343.1 UDP-N-acetylmuramoyl-tripeptide-D-alanyl-D-alanine ligase [Clostridium sp. N3C]